MRKLSLGLAACALFATSAAGAFPVTATLQTPVSQRIEVLLGHAIWTCEANTCSADATEETMDVFSCQEFVKKLGKITDYARTESAKARINYVERCNAVKLPAGPTKITTLDGGVATIMR